ncbi:hypothetical protein L576_1805 [Bordetella bronchiseptica OSU054]|nr:hypothetical protein L576_1805 [Bordetella bronchiseptica OSU054]
MAMNHSSMGKMSLAGSAAGSGPSFNLVMVNLLPTRTQGRG